MNSQLASQVPDLTTALSGPLLALEKHFLQNQAKIETWLREQWRISPAPIHSSVDLRNAGFKIAPVDTNLFPAGFNNLNPEFLPLCIQAMQSVMDSYFPDVAKVLLIPENHTRNLFYLESLANLHEIIRQAGFEVQVGSMLETLTEPQTLTLPSGREICLQPIERVGDRIQVENFKPDLIFLNNDLSSGIPELLQNIQQPICPPASLGWSTRLKSTHFSHYGDVTTEFAQQIDLDPWLLSPLFQNCGEVDFMRGTGYTCVEQNVQELLDRVQEKYDEYQVTEKPFVVVKADAGTYGMGVMMVQDTEQLRALNRKERTRMSKAKGSIPITKVIIQEGVYSFETWGEKQSVAEPVVYMLGQHVVGGFYRVHTERGSNENLNAPGMHFEPLAFVEPCNSPCAPEQDECRNRFYTYGVVARLALLAAAREIVASS